jgi:hypothetical protein
VTGNDKLARLGIAGMNWACLSEASVLFGGQIVANDEYTKSRRTAGAILVEGAC